MLKFVYHGIDYLRTYDLRDDQMFRASASHAEPIQPSSRSAAIDTQERVNINPVVLLPTKQKLYMASSFRLHIFSFESDSVNSWNTYTSSNKAKVTYDIALHGIDPKLL